VGYYGSFVVKDSFNLILEYADKGDLDSYFRKNKQPTAPRDIFRFWKAFFRLIYGLLKIHNAGDRELDLPHNLLGRVDSILMICVILTKLGSIKISSRPMYWS